MMRIKAEVVFLAVAALMLALVDASRTSVPLYLLAENVDSGSQVPSEEAASQQEIPANDSNKDFTPPQSEPQPVDPPEQQGQLPVEHEQQPEPEPVPQSSSR